MNEEPLALGGSAQPFGFGAISRLMALEGGLRAHDKGKNAKFYVPFHPQFQSFLDEKQHRMTILGRNTGKNPHPLEQFFGHPELAGLDGIISSYDSAAAFYGWFHDVPVFLYDGLFWFWNFKEHEQKIPGVMRRLEKTKAEKDPTELVKIYNELLADDYHATILVAYHLSNHIYVRRALELSDRLNAYPQLKNKILIVGAMIDQEAMPESERAEDYILVSLGGSLASTVPFEQNIDYARSALSFVKDAAKQQGDAVPWVFVCHPEIYKVLNESGELSELPGTIKVRPSAGYHGGLELVGKAKALFIAPGLNLIEEAAYYQKPVFFLPEQNGGQPKNINMLKKAGYATEFNLTVTDNIPQERPLGEYDIDQLYRGINAIWSDAMAPTRAAICKGFFEMLQDPTRRLQLVSSQRAAILKLVGDFDAVPTIIHDVLNRIQSLS